MEVTKKRTIPITVLTIALIGAISSVALVSMRANAATDNTSSSTQTAPAAQDGSVAHHTGANGVKEELLTGDTASKIKAAALAANPGATIQRVETDAEGATYEAHMTKSDGTRITVKFDKDFKITATETGGPGGPGHPGDSQKQ